MVWLCQSAWWRNSFTMCLSNRLNMHFLNVNNSVNCISKAKKRETYCKACTSQFLILIKHLLDFLAKLTVLNLTHWHMFVTSVTLGYHPKWTSQSNLLCALFSVAQMTSIVQFHSSTVKWICSFFENLADNYSSWFNWSFSFSLLLQLQTTSLKRT